MNRPTRNRITLVLLAVGFVAAVVIYLTAPQVIIDPLLGDPIDSKGYVRQLRLYGGRANVLSAEFQDWFAGLWHGQTLAYTVAALTVALTLGFRFFTPQNQRLDRPQPAPTEPDTPAKSGRPGDERKPGPVSP